VEIRGKFFPYYTPYLLQVFQLHKKELSECWIATAPSGYRHRFTVVRGGSQVKVTGKKFEVPQYLRRKTAGFCVKYLKKIATSTRLIRVFGLHPAGYT
jgi:hypothetical protein